MLNINLRVPPGIIDAALFRTPRNLFAFLQMVVICSLTFHFCPVEMPKYREYCTSIWLVFKDNGMREIFSAEACQHGTLTLFLLN